MKRRLRAAAKTAYLADDADAGEGRSDKPERRARTSLRE